MRRMARGSVTAILALVALHWMGAQAGAQEVDLTGSWTLSIEDSDFGATRPPQSTHLLILRADSELRITSSRDIGEGPQIVEIDIPVDGAQHDVETPRGTLPMSAEWDGSVLVTWRRAMANVGEIDVRERYSIDDSGRLQVESTIDVPQAGVFETTMVFLKADA